MSDQIEPPNPLLISQDAPVLERKHRYATRIDAHAALVAAQHPGVPVHIDWPRVPAGLRTRGQWEELNRRVTAGQRPGGGVVCPEVVTVRDDAGRPTGYYDVRCRTVRVYREDQTAAFVPSAKELAHRTFFDTFVRPASRERYGYWSPDAGEWKSVQGRLTKEHVRGHVNGTGIYGVYGGDRTRFVAIDHDLHRGDRDVYLAQLEALLDEFVGRDGWHVQVADRNAGGVHLIRVVPEAKLAGLRADLRDRLRRLCSKHSSLAGRAAAAGMRPLGELEIYPDPQQVFRLPLCRGRTMLLDRPLALVPNPRARLGAVQDVVGYVRWLGATAGRPG